MSKPEGKTPCRAGPRSSWTYALPGPLRRSLTPNSATRATGGASLSGCLASIAEALPALLLVLKHWPHSRQHRTALRVQAARRSIESSTSGDVAGPQATQSHRRCLFCREACELGSCLDAERAVRVWQASRL